MEATFDLIAQYLAGDLSEKERQEFDGAQLRFVPLN